MKNDKMPVQPSFKANISKLGELLSNRIVFLACLAVAFAFTIARGFRLPNDWAEAHWLIDYGIAGFIKRGLPGTVLGLFAPADPEMAIQCVSLVLLVVFLVAMFVRSATTALRDKPDAIIASIFLCSPFFVLSAHLNGYYDNILFLLGISSAYLLRRNRTLLASILLAAGVFVHETMLLVVLPAVLHGVFSRNLLVSNSNSAGFRKTMQSLVLPVFLPILAFAFVALFTAHGEAAEGKLIEHLSGFSFIGNGRATMVPQAFSTSFLSYLQSQSAEGVRRLFHPGYLLIDGVPLLAMLCLAWAKLRGLRCRKVVFSGLVLVTLLPLLLHFIAWDTSRIWSYSAIAFFLAYTSLQSGIPMPSNAEGSSNGFIHIIALLALFIVFAAPVPLMDGETDTMNTAARVAFYLPLLIVLGFRVGNSAQAKLG